jgi:hypothetical protein
MPLLPDLLRSPDHYLHSFDGPDAVFVRMDREAYHRSIFLDQRIQPLSPEPLIVPLRDMGAMPEIDRVGWIFHLAHSGSTLLARALDVPDGNLVLREPLALRQMGVAYEPARLDIVLAMLGRRYATDLPTIVKANVPVNAILPQIAARSPSVTAIFLWCPLHDWLLAVLRSPGHRQWVRGITQQLSGWLGDLPALDDACLAAALWLKQMRAFEAAMTLWPEARSLNAECFFADPAPVMMAAAALLDVPVDADRAARIVDGELFASDAKRPAMTFNNEMRLARRAMLATELKPELARAQRWLEAKGAGDVALGRSLI